MEICIRNLSQNITEGDLRGVFEEFGKVASVSFKPANGHNGHKKDNIALVVMPVEEEARKAISYTDGIELNGRNLTVYDAGQDVEEDIENDYSDYENEGEEESHVKHTKRHNRDIDKK